MKLAVAEGDRAGSVEHLVHAALPAASGLTLSELMVGGPLEVGELLTPTIGYQINFGAVHGYVEAYGANTDGVTMEFEVATDAGRAGAAQRRRADSSGHRDARDLHEGDADAGAAAGQVRAARDPVGRRRVDQDADPRLRDRAAEGAADVGRGPRQRVGRRRAVPAGRRRHDVAAVRARRWRSTRRRWRRSASGWRRRSRPRSIRAWCRWRRATSPRRS